MQEGMSRGRKVRWKEGGKKERYDGRLMERKKQKEKAGKKASKKERKKESKEESKKERRKGGSS